MSEDDRNYYSASRYKYARCPGSDRINKMLIKMIQASVGKEELLANDIIELMALMRFGTNGFQDAERLTEMFLNDYINSP